MSVLDRRSVNVGNVLVLLLLACFLPAGPAYPTALPDTLVRVKASIVAIGSYARLRQPPAVFVGTGFVVGEGNHVITNAHVIPGKLNTERGERLGIFFGDAKRPQFRPVKELARDEDHDLVVLGFAGAPLPALAFGDSRQVREGEQFAFTGYPIGMVLGLYPATHRGIVSAISPDVLPAHTARGLDAAQIRRLKQRFDVFQLDATAYPGNSGSPLYDPGTGQVVGVINKVFVKESKENLLKAPSGITYAIPGQHALRLLGGVLDRGGTQ